MKKPVLPAPRTVELSEPQIRAAIERFQRRIREVEDFDPQKVTDRKDPNIDALEAAIGEALTETFGHDTPARRPYAAAATLDTAGINMNGTPHHEVIEGLVHGRERSIVLMTRAIRSLEERLADRANYLGTAPPVDAPATTHTMSRDIFIVHGHDTAAKNEVAHVINRAGLNAIILHEQPNGGRTIIEKFEAHGSAAGFAVILLTPDDVGGATPDQLRPRARQNVVGEMFWFAGKLGRSKVCALRKGDVEVPSDFAGVVYTEMDDRGAWRIDLLKELEAAGYSGLDWGKALASAG